MSFREKTAWVMGALMMAAAGFYAYEVWGAAQAFKGWPPPLIKLTIVYIVIVVLGSIISMTTLAVSAPKEANAPADERERVILDRAGNWSGYVLAWGAVAGVIHYFVSENGNLLFHTVVGALMASQILEYVFQIVLMRRGV